MLLSLRTRRQTLHAWDNSLLQPRARGALLFGGLALLAGARTKAPPDTFWNLPAPQHLSLCLFGGNSEPLPRVPFLVAKVSGAAGGLTSSAVSGACLQVGGFRGGGWRAW